MPTRRTQLGKLALTLDARPDRTDLRDLPYRPPVSGLPPRYPSDTDIARLLPGYIKAELILDQGKEGACTGFGLAAVVNYLLWIRSGMEMSVFDRVSPRMLYQLARFYDEWPGEDYEGSSCRGALKGWHKHGVCLERLWPTDLEELGKHLEPLSGWDVDAVNRPLGVYYRIDRESVVDMQAAIRQTGAIYVSAHVHKGWAVNPTRNHRKNPSHETLPRIDVDKERIGGHAFALVGYNEHGFIVQNSWGMDWGASGFAVLRYEDWVANGTDAWVVGLGVPVENVVRGQQRGKAITSPKRYVRQTEKGRLAGIPGWMTGDDPLKGKPGALSEDEAYEHTLVTGNDGYILNRLPFAQNATMAAGYVCLRKPAAWLQGQAVRRLVVYAHGGLNDEEESIKRIRVMAPYFKENGIYPVFVTWKSGWKETIGNILQDESKKQLGSSAPVCGIGDVVNEAWDRAIEVLARAAARGLWSEMKENVAAGEADGRGIDVLAEQLVELDNELGGSLEVHLVGHSAGSFVCGRLLAELSALRSLRVRSCTLYAPACDADFGLRYFRDPIDGGILNPENLHIHVLSDRRELDDTVGPYCKSLLYLVSRAFEKRHKTPILGLVTAFDPACASDEYWHADTVRALTEWQQFFYRGPAPADFGTGNLHIVDDKQVFDGVNWIKASHGCFDNSISIVGNTIARMLDVASAKELKYPLKDLGFD